MSALDRRRPRPLLKPVLKPARVGHSRSGLSANGEKLSWRTRDWLGTDGMYPFACMLRTKAAFFVKEQ